MIQILIYVARPEIGAVPHGLHSKKYDVEAEGDHGDKHFLRRDLERHGLAALATTWAVAVVAKAVLIGAAPPIMLRKDANPGGLPIDVFDGFRGALVANRAQFFLDVPSGQFYGFNRPGAQISEGVIRNWGRQRMMGGMKAHCDCIKAFSETDFAQDLRVIEVPTLVMHCDDDQIVP